MAKRTPLAEQLDKVEKRSAEAATKAKRQPSEVTLVAVTKTAAPSKSAKFCSWVLPTLPKAGSRSSPSGPGSSTSFSGAAALWRRRCLRRKSAGI